MKDQFIEAHKKGNFLEVLDSTYKTSKDKRDLIFETLVSLHNDGDIDVLEEFQKLECELGSGINFYSIKGIIETVIPKLNAPVEKIIKCIKHLIQEEGDHANPRMLFNSFIEYCKENISRSDEVLSMSLDGKWLDFLESALVAGANIDLEKYIDITIKQLDSDQENIRAIAISSIGKIKYSNKQEQIKKSINALKTSAQLASNLNLFPKMLESSYNLLFQSNIIEKDVCDLSKLILSSKKEQTTLVASNLFGFYDHDLPESFLDILLKYLESTNIDNKYTLANISHGLVALMKNKQEKAFSLLEILLITNQDKLSLKDFDHFYHEIFFNEQIRNKAITRWLISKKIPLYRAAMELVNQARHKDVELSLDKSILAKHGKPDYVFIARKSIGWFSIKPVSSISFIVSFLDDVDKDEAKQILGAAFEFLLLNYSGKVKEYLEEIIPRQTKKVKKMLNQLLDDLKTYQTGLEETGKLQELLPSLAHRESHARLHHHQMSELQKEAEKSSFIGQIATRVLLLYGRGSIHYMSSSDDSDQTTRIETPLQSIETSFEVARLDRIDPQGYDYWMHIFRVEGCS